MNEITFRRAFYIKLGRGGEWESDAIANDLLRFGWPDQTVKDINTGAWDRIEAQLRGVHGVKRNVATGDINRLRDIVDSTAEDIWVSFHQAKLWWTRLAPGPVGEDKISKFRKTLEPWRDTALKGRLLIASELPGRIAQLQGFRGTACSVREPALLALVLNERQSDHARSIAATRSTLMQHLATAIKDLHWSDFETLVDLIFRHSGWTRVSVLGKQAKAYDLELREPVTQERYVVQVKSKASLKDLIATRSQFSQDDYRRVFFVVHSPAKDLESPDEFVEVIGPERLAHLAIDAGLLSWVESKAW